MTNSWHVFMSGRARSDVPAPVARPAWLGPPDDELGRAVDVATVLARSGNGVVAFAYVVAYSTGLSLNLFARAMGLKRSAIQNVFQQQHMGFSPDDDEELPEGLLRLGLELPGGARVSNLGGHPGWQADHPEGPVLFANGGGGGQSNDQSVELHPGYWLWPLVEAGTMRISVEWPLVGIPFTTVELDATPFREAGLRAVKL